MLWHSEIEASVLAVELIFAANISSSILSDSSADS